MDQAIKECQSVKPEPVKPDINSNIDLTSKPSESELVLTSSDENTASKKADLYGYNSRRSLQDTNPVLAHDSNTSDLDSI